MSMFQNSVLKSFSQDESLVALRWAEFQKYLAKIDFIKSVKEEINKTDKEIDQMVYKLYDLTDGEIKIVENS